MRIIDKMEYTTLQSEQSSNTSKSEWDIAFEESLQSLCDSVNILGNIDRNALVKRDNNSNSDQQQNHNNPPSYSTVFPNAKENSHQNISETSKTLSSHVRSESSLGYQETHFTDSGCYGSDSIELGYHGDLDTYKQNNVGDTKANTTAYVGRTSSRPGYNNCDFRGYNTDPDTVGIMSDLDLWLSQLQERVNKGSDMVHHIPRFVRDTSKFWYKPHISREDAINMLKDKHPGTFVVRDSNSFPGAFGLALKVAQVPPNVQTKGDPQAELVRHFLIEPTPKGVKLKGCSNEPVFGSLAALVYQHSITPLALPCKLKLPENVSTAEPVMISEDPASMDVVDARKDVNSSTILTAGAACNVLYISSIDMESLTGREAVSKAIKDSLLIDTPSKTTVVHFKVSSQGVTLTDNKRKLFFRRHYPINTVTYCGMDPEDRRWSMKSEESGIPMNAKLFGFVARKQGSNTDNACHVFAELDPDQPAHAICNFVSKVMVGQGQFMKS